MNKLVKIWVLVTKKKKKKKKDILNQKDFSVNKKYSKSP